jgi:hypothetical protein
MLCVMKSIALMLLWVVFIALLHPSTEAFQPGDRVSASSQSFHSNAKTNWLDLPSHQMPVFARESSHIFHVNLPDKGPKNANNPHLKNRLDITKDLKVSFSFDRSKLLIPQVTVFDAQNRRSARKLIVTFTHDEFEVVRLRTETIYGNAIPKIDASHPALRGFELDYRWESVQEEDFALGVIFMFCSVILGFLILFFMVVCTDDSSDVILNSSDGPTKKIRH